MVPEDIGTHKPWGSLKQLAPRDEHAGRGAGGNRAAVTNEFNS